MDKLVSILVPCYKSKPFLKRFFNSLLKQDLNQAKIIFFNDNVADETYEVLQKFKKEHNNLAIEVYCDKQNEGIGKVRDKLVNLVTTPYFYFIDPDDCFNNKNVIKEIVESIKKEDFDLGVLKSMVYLCFLKHDFIIKFLPLKGIFQGRVKLINNNNVNKLNYIKNNDQYIWNIVINTDFFRKLNLTFESRLFEDIPIWYPMFFSSQKIVFIDVIGTNYFIRNDSLSTTISAPRYLNLIQCYEKLYVNLSQNGSLASFIDPNHKIEARFWRRQMFVWFALFSFEYFKKNFSESKKILEKLFVFLEKNGIYERVFQTKNQGIYYIWVQRLKYFKHVLESKSDN